MGFFVNIDEPVVKRRLKLLYLIPLAIVIYPLMVIIAGVKEVGNPIADIVEAWRR